MEDEKKAKRQLIEELHALRRRVADLKGFEEEIGQIKVSHEKFSKAFLKNSVPASITTMKEGRFVDISDAFLGLMGRKRNEVVGHTLTEIGLISEEQRVAFFNELNKRGHIENLEAEVKTKDGALRHGLFNAVLMSINNEKYLLTVMTDITERKRAEEALRESEEKYRSLIQNIHDGVYILDSSGKFTFVNDVIVKRSGFPAEWFVGRSYLNVIRVEDSERVQRRFNAVLEGNTQIYTLAYPNKAGDLLHVEVSTAPLFDGAKVIGLLGVSRDVTKRKSMEKALAEEHRRLASILDGSPVSSFVIDRDRRVTAWNMVNEYFTGISKQDILGKPLDLSLLFKDRVPPSLAELVLEMTDEEILQRYGHKGIRKSRIHPQALESVGSIWIKGEEHILAIQASRLHDTAGNIIGAIQCAQDMTKQKRYEEALRESEATSWALINAPTDSVLLMDAQGLILELNEIAAKRLGKSREDLIGTLADNAIPEDIARTRRSLISRMFETGRAVRFEDGRDGGWYDTVAYPIADADGRVGRIAVIARDISDRKHMEEELTSQQGRLEVLVEERTRELEIKTHMLEDINVALKVLLRQRDDDRQELENRFAANITGLILPYVAKMKSESLDMRPRSYLSIIEANLKELLSPLMHNMRQYNLTPKEIIVASLIKDGKTTKDIADIMGVGTSAIDSHRNRIREKLNLIKEKTNLQSYLLSIK